MKSIFSILSAAVCFNLLVGAALAADNYSLWPRRPAELEQARRLVREQKGAEAVHLLQPFIHDNGIAGREARQITGSVNVQRYLSRRHPDARVYTVKPGDNVFKIAAAEKCPLELIMLLNGIVEPSGLRVGQKLVLVPVVCHLEIRPAQRELCVWAGNTLIADYTLTGIPLEQGQLTSGEDTAVQMRDAYIEGTKLSARSFQVLSADRVIVLTNGLRIGGKQAKMTASGLYMAQKDANELALLVCEGTPVSISDK